MKKRDKAPGRLSSPDRVVDLVDSVKQYARQETIGPLRGAFRWLAFGLGAAVFLGLAMIFALLAVLRLSQHLGGTTLDGSWSFVHYGITLLVGGLAVAVTLSRIGKSSLNKDA